MKEPYTRVLMAVSYMKGEKVKNWVRQQVELLDEEVDEKGIDKGDERLWSKF